MVLGLGESLDARELTTTVLDVYTGLKAVAVSVRESNHATQHSCSASLNDRADFLRSRQYDMPHVVDRIGAGDAFSAGLIYGWRHFSTRQEALEFAVAANSLKHSIPGDFFRATAEEVTAVLRNEPGGRIRR